MNCKGFFFFRFITGKEERLWHIGGASPVLFLSCPPCTCDRAILFSPAAHTVPETAQVSAELFGIFTLSYPPQPLWSHLSHMLTSAFYKINKYIYIWWNRCEMSWASINHSFSPVTLSFTEWKTHSGIPRDANMAKTHNKFWHWQWQGI